MTELEASPVDVTLIATPQTQVAPLSGLYEALTAFPLLAGFEADLPDHPFDVRIAAPRPLASVGANQLHVRTHCVCEDIQRTDVAIVPLMVVEGPSWTAGR
jgi:hypothetical protein